MKLKLTRQQAVAMQSARETIAANPDWGCVMRKLGDPEQGSSTEWPERGRYSVVVLDNRRTYPGVAEPGPFEHAQVRTASLALAREILEYVEGRPSTIKIGWLWSAGRGVYPVQGGGPLAAAQAAQTVYLAACAAKYDAAHPGSCW